MAQPSTKHNGLRLGRACIAAAQPTACTTDMPAGAHAQPNPFPAHAQVGACIVDANNVICGIGYNGFPRGCADSEVDEGYMVQACLPSCVAVAVHQQAPRYHPVALRLTPMQLVSAPRPAPLCLQLPWAKRAASGVPSSAPAYAALACFPCLMCSCPGPSGQPAATPWTPNTHMSATLR